MKKLISITFFSLLSLKVFSSIPIYYWENQAGIIEAKNCKIETQSTQRLKISASSETTSVYEHLENYNGIKQSYLKNSSLVKTIEGKNKKSFKKIKVLGVNQLGSFQSKWLSERGAELYISDKAIKTPNDYLIEVVGPILQSSVLNTNILEIAHENKYFSLECPDFTTKRKYILFNVFEQKDLLKPVALLAIYHDETEIFKSIKVSKRQVPLTKKDTVTNIAISLNKKVSSPVVPTIDPNYEIVPEQKVTPKKTELTVIEGSFKDILCLEEKHVFVRDDNMKIAFKASKGEYVKVFQDWNGISKKETTVNSYTFTLVKVEFPNREPKDQKMGWVAQAFVAQSSTCPYVKKKKVNTALSEKIHNIDDEKCCEFPTMYKTTRKFYTGARAFGSSRADGKRKHAGNDLYRKKDEPVVAVAPGKILRNRYYFYQGTYALEVLHSGGFVARYGELTSKEYENTKAGNSVMMGEKLGNIGVVNSKCCKPMLHFELYSGDVTGSLNASGNKYKRRSDLIDPTTYLKKWAAKKFK